MKKIIIISVIIFLVMSLYGINKVSVALDGDKAGDNVLDSNGIIGYFMNRNGSFISTEIFNMEIISDDDQELFFTKLNDESVSTCLYLIYENNLFSGEKIRFSLSEEFKKISECENQDLFWVEINGIKYFPHENESFIEIGLANVPIGSNTVVVSLKTNNNGNDCVFEKFLYINMMGTEFYESEEWLREKQTMFQNAIYGVNYFEIFK